MSISREQDGLRGPVRSVRTTSAEFSEEDGRFVDNPLSTLTTYDAGGNKTEETHHYPGFNHVIKIALLYDGRGSLVERSEYADDSLTSKRVFTYDQIGRLTEETFSRADGSLLMRAVSTYDGRGIRNEVIREGADLGKDHRIYDGVGRLLESGTYFAGAQDIESTYNARGDWTATTFYDAERMQLRKIVLDYDGRGLLIRLSDYLGNVYLRGALPDEMIEEGEVSPAFRTVYAYDEEGRRVEEIMLSADESLLSKKVYMFDGMGNKIEEAEFGADGTSLRMLAYRYEYDGRGNWTKRTTSMWVQAEAGFRPVAETERTVTYASA